MKNVSIIRGKHAQSLDRDEFENAKHKALAMLAGGRAWFLVVIPEGEYNDSIYDVKVSAVGTADDASVLEDAVEELRGDQQLGFAYEEKNNGTEETH